MYFLDTTIGLDQLTAWPWPSPLVYIATCTYFAISLLLWCVHWLSIFRDCDAREILFAKMSKLISFVETRVLVSIRVPIMFWLHWFGSSLLLQAMWCAMRCGLLDRPVTDTRAVLRSSWLAMNILFVKLMVTLFTDKIHSFMWHTVTFFYNAAFMP